MQLRFEGFQDAHREFDVPLVQDLLTFNTGGSLADGMLPKAAAIDAALANGVSRVHVISYKVPDSLLLEVFTNEGTGTLVVNDVNALTPAEQAGAEQ